MDDELAAAAAAREAKEANAAAKAAAGGAEEAKASDNADAEVAEATAAAGAKDEEASTEDASSWVTLQGHLKVRLTDDPSSWQRAWAETSEDNTKLNIVPSLDMAVKVGGCDVGGGEWKGRGSPPPQLCPSRALAPLEARASPQPSSSHHPCVMPLTLQAKKQNLSEPETIEFELKDLVSIGIEDSHDTPPSAATGVRGAYRGARRVPPRFTSVVLWLECALHHSITPPPTQPQVLILQCADSSRNIVTKARSTRDAMRWAKGIKRRVRCLGNTTAAIHVLERRDIAKFAKGIGDSDPALDGSELDLEHDLLSAYVGQGS